MKTDNGWIYTKDRRPTKKDGDMVMVIGGTRTVHLASYMTACTWPLWQQCPKPPLNHQEILEDWRKR